MGPHWVEIRRRFALGLGAVAVASALSGCKERRCGIAEPDGGCGYVVAGYSLRKEGGCVVAREVLHTEAWEVVDAGKCMYLGEIGDL